MPCTPPAPGEQAKTQVHAFMWSLVDRRGGRREGKHSAGQVSQPSTPPILPGAQGPPRRQEGARLLIHQFPAVTRKGAAPNMSGHRPGIHLGPQKHLEKKTTQGQAVGSRARRMKGVGGTGWPGSLCFAPRQAMKMGMPAAVMKRRTAGLCENRQIPEARCVCPKATCLPLLLPLLLLHLAGDGWAVRGCRQAHLETALSWVDGRTSHRTAPTPETPRATSSAALGSRAAEDD